jgi:hypothetical protein
MMPPLLRTVAPGGEDPPVCPQLHPPSDGRICRLPLVRVVSLETPGTFSPASHTHHLHHHVAPSHMTLPSSSEYLPRPAHPPLLISFWVCMNAITKNRSPRTLSVPAAVLLPSRVPTLMHSFGHIFCARATSPSSPTSLGTSFRWDVESLRTTPTPTILLQTNHGSQTCIPCLSIPVHPPPMTTQHCLECAILVSTPAHSLSVRILTGLNPLLVCQSWLFRGHILPPLFLWGATPLSLLVPSPLSQSARPQTGVAT